MMNCKFILIYIPSIENGGVERNAIWLANSLVEKGFNVSIFYCRADKQKEKQISESVNKIKSPWIKLPFIHPRLCDAFWSLIYLSYILVKSEQIKVISFQSNSVSILICRLFNVPVVARLSNDPSHAQNESSILRKISEKLKVKTYVFANKVIGNSEELSDNFSYFTGLPVDTIYNPIDFDKIKKLGAVSVNHKWLLDKKDPVIVTIARLVKQKDLWTLLRAIEISKSFINFRVIIIGDGEEADALKKYCSRKHIQDVVDFVGYQENVYKYLTKADLFIQTSLYEGLPTVLIEAIAAGLPVISTNCPSGPKEILLNGTGGYLVPVADETILSQKILEVFSDYDTALKKRDIAYRALNRFESHHVLKRYVQVIENA